MLSSYGIAERIFGIIKNFLSRRRSLMAIPQRPKRSSKGLLFGPTLFLLYVNGMPKSILQSFVKISPFDTLLHGCIYKMRDDQSLIADLFSDLVLTAQWGKMVVTFNASKTNYNILSLLSWP